MIKEQVIKHYHTTDIVAIIPQHHGRSISLFLKYGGASIILIVLYNIISGFNTNTQLINLIFLIIQLAILGMFNYSFLLLYLDSAIITSQGITIMDQVGLLTFTKTSFERDNIQTISYEQHGIVDRILNKGDIMLSIEHGTVFTIPNVVNPNKRVERINQQKYNSILEQAKVIALSQEQETNQQDKFDILVDKLSDIIVNHMQTPRNEEAIIDYEDIIQEDDLYPELYHEPTKE